MKPWDLFRPLEDLGFGSFFSLLIVGSDCFDITLLKNPFPTFNISTFNVVNLSFFLVVSSMVVFNFTASSSLLSFPYFVREYAFLSLSTTFEYFITVFEDSCIAKKQVHIPISSEITRRISPQQRNLSPNAVTLPLLSTHPVGNSVDSFL